MLRISKDHKEHSMAHDLVIRNGLIVDGQQTAAYDADLAIDGDAITAVRAKRLQKLLDGLSLIHISEPTRPY